jgi:AAA family ATP:ADP antiporter
MKYSIPDHAAIRLLLRKAFDIREGEGRRATLMQAYIFLIICNLLILKPTVNALFLSYFGAENLPKAFILVAIFAALISALYARGLNRFSLHTIIKWTLYSSIVILTLFGALLQVNVFEGIVIYLFYIWVAVFAVLSASQFWILANMVFNAREAKRLFGFIGSGAIAGGIFGGYLASILTAFLSSQQFPFVSAFLLALCIPLSEKIWKRYVKGAHSTFERKKRIKSEGKRPFALIRHSRHLTFLASIIGVSVIVAKLVDYQFSAIASAKITDPDELTAFFGFWFSNFNVISLLVQLLLTRRVVGVFGVGVSLFILPMGILVGAVLLLVFPQLWAAILIKMSDGSLKQSVNKAAIELLALPIPSEIKSQTKTFIDVFVDSAATGIGGLILIFLVSGLDLSTAAISLMIIVMIGLWIYFAVRIRKEYIRSFKLKIQGQKDRKAKKEIDLSKESVIGGLIGVLSNGSEKQMHYVLTKVRELSDDRLFSPIRNLLQHESPQIRAEALRNLYFFRNHNIVEEVQPLTRDPYQMVKVEAFNYLVAHSDPENSVEVMEQFLADEDERIRAAALVSLARESRNNPVLQSNFALEDKIRQFSNGPASGNASEDRRFRQIAILKVVGYGNLPVFYPMVKDALHDHDEAVARQAIISAGRTLSPDFVDPLIRLLDQKIFVSEAQKALAHYGEAILPELRQRLDHSSLPVEIVRNVPGILENMAEQTAVNFLFDLLDYEDLSVRLESLRSLNNLKQRVPFLYFDKKYVIQLIMEEARVYRDTLAALQAQTRTLSTKKQSKAEGDLLDARKSLINLLERRLDGNLERIFQLLGLRYPPEDINNIYESIQSKKADLRVNAIEFLDNLLETNLKKVLIPIVETAMLDTLTESAIENMDLKIPDEYHCLSMLLQGKDLKVKMATLFLIGQIKETRYVSLAAPFLESPHQKLRDFARAAITACMA